MEKNKNIFRLANNSEYHHREMGLKSDFLDLQPEKRVGFQTCKPEKNAGDTFEIPFRVHDNCLTLTTRRA